MFKKIASAAALFIASSAALAGAPNTFYTGAEYGKTDEGNWHNRETSYGAFAGYHITGNIAVEAGYRRLFDYNRHDYKVTGETITLSAIGSIPVGESFSVFGRLGASRLEEKVRFNSGSFSAHDNHAVIGLGVGYTFTRDVAGRIEFQKTGSDLRNLSVGVSYQF